MQRGPRVCIDSHEQPMGKVTRVVERDPVDQPRREKPDKSSDTGGGADRDDPPAGHEPDCIDIARQPRDRSSPAGRARVMSVGELSVAELSDDERRVSSSPPSWQAS
jgi:hypothetical protein